MAKKKDKAVVGEESVIKGVEDKEGVPIEGQAHDEYEI